ncbi:hypothetical protein B5S30_g3268 [[Candida] boidinii]|nr:hypothetical protein B5S30_g3268 [[Candida] boidinii]GMF98674.1 unnamed protein product [[Candida] boidinii]
MAIRTKPITAVVLDIEGTVCPISFVKEILFPFFIEQLPEVLEQYEYPLKETESSDDDQVYSTLLQFPKELHASKQLLSDYINDLVSRDIKDPVLKKLQGLVWAKGYESNLIKSPIYKDAIDAIEKWAAHLSNGVYIYSSGSVQAQKLLFGHVESVTENSSIDLNNLIIDYFDTINVGPKIETSSYTKILKKIKEINHPTNVLFLSDNINEVNAAIDAGMQSFIVIRPGNAELTKDQIAYHTVIDNFEDLIQ